MDRDTERPTFVADAMLGRLAKALRMLGFDVVYRPDIADGELKMVALREKRVVLTRDHEVAETRLPVDVLFVESDHVEEQLRQTVDALGLRPSAELFTRCLVCNVAVEDAAREDVRDDVPPYVYETQRRFARCPSCGRVYWAATHVERAREWLDDVLGTGRGGPSTAVRENGGAHGPEGELDGSSDAPGEGGCSSDAAGGRGNAKEGAGDERDAGS